MTKTAIRYFVALCCVLTATVALAAVNNWPVVKWIGPDGGKWSNPDNWVVNEGTATEAHRCPTNWDNVVIPATDAPLTLDNDIKSLYLVTIKFTGTQPITLTGNRYTLHGFGEYAYASFVSESTAAVTNATDITLSSSIVGLSCVNKNAKAVITGLVKKDTNESIVPQGDGRLVFAGGLDAPLALLKPLSAMTVDFDGMVKVKDVNYGSYPAQAGFIYNFNAAGNLWTNVMVGTWGVININAANGFSPHTVLRWKNDAQTMDDVSVITFKGDQTIDRIISTDPTYGGVFKDKSKLNGLNNGVLTLKATDNATCYARLYGAFSLVYDPLGDFTQEFIGRTSDMSGSITVKGGTLRVSGANVFSTVSTVTIAAGGALDVATDAAVTAFPAVQDLTLEAGATLYLTNGAVNAFATDAVRLNLKTGAKIVVSDTAVLSFANVMVDGVQQPVGSYTGASGVPGTIKADWLEGAATVSVKAAAGVNYWVKPVSGNWEDASKWSQGVVPTAGQAVYVVAAGADYTVTINDRVDQAGAWTVSNANGCATLQIAGIASNKTQAVTLDEGGVLEVAAGGLYSVNGTPQLKVGPGATWRVAGGTCDLIGNAPRYFTFAGDSAHTSTVEVTSGTLVIGTTTTYPLKVPEFGLLKATGGQVKIRRAGDWGQRLAYTTGGKIDISGTAEYILDGSGGGNYFSLFGDGETVFSGTSRFKTSTSSGSIGVCATAADKRAEWTICDEARINWFQDANLRVGNSVGTNILNFASSADQGYSSSGNRRMADLCFVGCDGGYGEINVSNGYVPLGYGNGVRVGGTMATTLAGRKTCAGCEGRLRVSGGVLDMKGAVSLEWWFANSLFPPGSLTFGYGAFTLETSGRPYKGYMDLAGGIVTNKTDVILGAGYGTGTWTQSGGNAFVGYSETVGLRLGVVGGEGRMDLTGGTLTGYGTTWIGGSPLQSFGDVGTALVARAEFPYHRHDATGKLRIAGGAFKAEKFVYWMNAPVVYVGADGAGEIEMDGAAGSFEAARVVLSNSVIEAGTEYEAKTSATLRFTLDADGAVSPLKATSSLVVTPGSKLVVDVSKVTAETWKARNLVVTPSMVGTFAATDIEVVGPAARASRVKVRQSATGVRLYDGRGLLIFIK